MTRRPFRSLVATALIAAIIGAACESAQPSTGPSTPPTSGASSRPGTTQAPEASPEGSPAASAAVLPTNPAPALDRISISLEPFVRVPDAPVAIAAPNDGTGRLFVATRDGVVWVVERDGDVLGEPLMDLRARIRSGGEQGLLGIATHPTFPTDPRVFVNYTDQEGDTVIASLALDPANPNRLDPGSHARLMFVDQPFSNHNGGGVLFGPDGYLYLSLGDGGGGGDPLDSGQSLQSLLGKILRIDVDGGSGGSPYAVPRDNPFAAGGGLPEIWHLGLRNPWRLSFDRANGDLWIGDVGQAAWEEVDVARQGMGGGLNFGWNVMEGAHCYGSGDCSTDGLTPPISEYGRDLGCTVIGGYVYRGARFPFLVGAYLFTDFCTGRIFAIDAGSGDLVAPVTVGNSSGLISAFGEDADGELLVTSIDGNVSRIVATED